MTSKISQDFLTLRTIFNEFDKNEVLAKYPPEIAEKMIFHNNNIQALSAGNSSNFAFTINHNIYITKKSDQADFKVSIDRNAESQGTIIKEVRNPNNTHIFSHGKLTSHIKDQLIKKNIPFQYILKSGEEKTSFTTNTLNLFIQFFDMKNTEKYTFAHVIGETVQYTYSMSAANFIIGEIKKDPQNIYESLKKGLEAKRKR